jgi:hypothetical protein
MLVPIQDRYKTKIKQIYGEITHIKDPGNKLHACAPRTDTVSTLGSFCLTILKPTENGT